MHSAAFRCFIRTTVPLRPHRMSEKTEAQKTAYVNQLDKVELATEYHEVDFDWSEHAAMKGPLVALQEEEARKRQNIGSDGDKTLPRHEKDESTTVFEGHRWETFYQQHQEAKFYKLRRYVLCEFPALRKSGPVHVAEIGAGCGSSILPVLKANPQARATVTDVSSTCLEQLKALAAEMGIAQDPPISSFVCDSTDPSQAHYFKGLEADFLLIMFTLSAVTPEQQHEMLLNSFKALKPGGLLMLRDHGLYDMVQLRIPPEQWLAPNMYKRGDGTLAYFFSVEELSSRAAAAGFVVDEARYICVINRNKKTGVELRRVFVHGLFRKP